MYKRVSKEKTSLQFNLLKEVGYIILLVTFFIGITIGSLQFRNTDAESFKEYSENFSEILVKLENNDNNAFKKTLLYNGIRDIFIFWIAGMSIVGIPLLIGYLGYRGYSLGYTISAIIKLLGINAGNEYVFKHLFISSTLLVFFMILLGNLSIKLSKNFFEKRENIKADAFKYTLIVCGSLLLWCLAYFL